jgi:hypothetical protein
MKEHPNNDDGLIQGLIKKSVNDVIKNDAWEWENCGR